METIDGSAVEEEDYKPLNEILTFEPNERAKEVMSFWPFLDYYVTELAEFYSCRLLLDLVMFILSQNVREFRISDRFLMF